MSLQPDLRYPLQSGRIAAVLRLLLVLLLVATERLAVDEYTGAYYAVLVGYAAAALGSAAATWRRPTTTAVRALAAAVDLLVLDVLIGLTGSTGSAAWVALFLLLIAVAFQNGPAVTAPLAVAAVLSLLVLSTFGSSPDSSGVSAAEIVDAGYLAAAGVSSSLMSAVLAARTRHLTDLLAARGELLGQAMTAEERERRALAEALHDGALQNLLFARHEVERLRNETPDADTDDLDEILFETVRGLRDVVTELHPHILHELGLRAALGELAERMSRRGRIEVETALAEVVPHPDAGLLYSAARELLTNVAKHAAARHARISLSQVDGELALAIADDGRGLDPRESAGTARAGHIGLLSQRVRIAAAGGVFELRSEAGAGTEVRIRLPYPRGPAAETV